MTLAQGTAMLRYTEELKMYANVRDAESKKKLKKGESDAGINSMHDIGFLDEHWRDEVLGKWPQSKERGPWFRVNQKERTVMHVSV